MKARLDLISNSTKTETLTIINKLLDECYGIMVKPTHDLQTAEIKEGCGVRFSKTSDACYDYVGVVIYSPDAEIRLGGHMNSGINRITVMMNGDRKALKESFTGKLWHKLKELHDNKLAEPHAVVHSVEDVFYNHNPFVTEIEMNVKNFNHVARYIIDDALVLSHPEILLGIDDIKTELYLSRLQTNPSYYLDSVCNYRRYPTDAEHLYDCIRKIPKHLREEIALAGVKGDSCAPDILKPYLIEFVNNVLTKNGISEDRWKDNWKDNERFCYDIYYDIRHSADVEKLDKFFEFIKEENDEWGFVYK